MTYDFMLAPGQLATSAAQAIRFFEAQQDEAGSGDVEAIVAGLNGWNAVVNEAGKPELALKIVVAGDVVRATAPDAETAAAARQMMVTVANGLGYLVFDVAADTTAVPDVPRADVTITIGGERELSSVTEQDLHDWVPRLDQLASTPFLIVGRPNTNGLTYIQTFQNAADSYALEVQNGSVDQHYSTTLTDPAKVASLMWDWARGDFSEVNKIEWKREQL